jgi:hypothetical protein
MNQNIDLKLSKMNETLNIMQNDLKKYEDILLFLQQNIFLLKEMQKYDENSEMYKLRAIQFESNIIAEKMNKMNGENIFGPGIIE